MVKKRIFSDWLIKFNDKMKNENFGKIVLLLDNCTSHVDLGLSNIGVLILSSNTNSLIRPFDVCITINFKDDYRQLSMNAYCFHNQMTYLEI